MEYEELIKSLATYKGIQQELMADELSQAYLFLSPDLLTNNLVVATIAKMLICKNKCVCGNCPNCLKVEAKTHPDVLIYPKEKNFSVEDAGDIYNRVQVKSMLAEYKIFIINDIDKASESAQNKMLKIIEEPPKNVIFLISASNENNVLFTIKSRCQIRRIDAFNKNALVKNIDNNDKEISEIALSNGNGFLGKTFDILNNNNFINNYKNMINLLKNLKNSTKIPVFSLFFSKNKDIFEICLNIINDFFRDLLMLNLNKNNLIKNQNLISDFNEIKNEFSIIALIEILNRLNMVKQKLDSNVNLISLADNMLIDILEVKYLCK